MWRCIQDSGKYCNGTPEWEVEPTQHTLDGTPTYKFGGKCKLTPETCGKCKTSQQLYDELPQEEKDRMNRSFYKETQILKEKPEEKAKPKSKEAKKLKGEIAQGRLL